MLTMGPLRIISLIWLLLLAHVTTSYEEKAVEITDMIVPTTPQEGDDVTLTCRFKLKGTDHRLYTVNWWRDSDQFFQYKRSGFKSIHAYKFNGITVKEAESTMDTVVLTNVSEKTSGDFKCEVMGEAPAFRTAVQIKRMDVIVPPRRVEISSWPDTPTYRAGELVTLNCTADSAKPRASLKWTVNNHQVNDAHVSVYPDVMDSRERVTSTLGLHWPAPRSMTSMTLTFTCSASVGDYELRQERVVFLEPVSSVAYNHYNASAGTWNALLWKLLTLPALLLGRRRHLA
ncbi:uncharacterized protein LOC143018781 [Oratosquilla oratoria]|uniref:uncharacterized protein LOC143018781 n=1 Tax=Oratosquilla oratoria TaxID=337810 RepID=UPI003F7605AE